jgi:hypothetical protein
MRVRRTAGDDVAALQPINLSYALFAPLQGSGAGSFQSNLSVSMQGSCQLSSQAMLVLNWLISFGTIVDSLAEREYECSLSSKRSVANLLRIQRRCGIFNSSLGLLAVFKKQQCACPILLTTQQ